MKIFLCLLLVFNLNIWGHAEGHGPIINEKGIRGGHLSYLIPVKEKNLIYKNLLTLELLIKNKTLSFFLLNPKGKKTRSFHGQFKQAKIIIKYKNKKAIVKALSLNKDFMTYGPINFQIKELEVLEILLYGLKNPKVIYVSTFQHFFK